MAIECTAPEMARDESAKARFRHVEIGCGLERPRRNTRDEADELLDTAADHGISYNTANRYGDPLGTSEKFAGDWLAQRNRDNFVIYTMIGLPAGNGMNDDELLRRHVHDQVEASTETCLLRQ